MLSVSYMGSKRQIAPYVNDLASNLPDGPFLDVFSGMCAVAEAVAPNRYVWCNDTQLFATSVAKAFFKSETLPPSAEDAGDLLYEDYVGNILKLESRFGQLIKKEKALLKSDSISKIKEFYENVPHVGSSEILQKERKWLHYKTNTFPYRLFSITFAGGYFGVRQSTQIDSIRYGIDKLFKDGKITEADHLWMLLALCQAASKVSTSTGHFAQYLNLKKNNKRYYLKQRNKSVWTEWIEALDSFFPVGYSDWRKKNTIYQKDAHSLLEYLIKHSTHPAVIYADPPYTDDQYSRYYHLYETLILYDYPISEGKGRYRNDRYVSSFSLRTGVKKAIEDLIKYASAMKSTFILSYPSNGLLPESSESILSIMKDNFKKAEIVFEINHEHSSMGASKGLGKYPVKELLIMGRHK